MKLMSAFRNYAHEIVHSLCLALEVPGFGLAPHDRRRDAERSIARPILRQTLILDAYEIKPLWRGNDAAAAPVAGVARGNEVAGAPASAADMFQRASDRTHLGVEKRFRARLDMDLLASSDHVEPLQCAHRACRLALGRTKG